MDDEKALRKAFQERFERRYRRRQRFKNWVKIYLTLVVPVWIVMAPILCAAASGVYDTFADQLIQVLSIVSVFFGILLLLRGIDLYIILDRLEDRREADKQRQFEYELARARLAGEKAKRGMVRLGDDGELVFDAAEQPPKRKRS